MIRLDHTNITNQDILHQVEALCTQEEPPACTAACPLHLDARALCQQMAAGKFSQALQLYQKTIPFARIIAATCDAPCQLACRREERGGSIRLQELERFLVRSAGSLRPPPFLMKKDKKAAVCGGGLAGLTCALDLARKGYSVTIFEKSDQLGGRLRNLPEAVLPEATLEEEIQSLLAFDVEVRLQTEVPLATAEAAAAFLLTQHGAAFIACSSPLAGEVDGDRLLVRGQSRLLAGQRSGRWHTEPSVIYDVYDGRSAATTMDRLLQGVNVMAGREKDGSRETTLFTNIEPFSWESPIEGGPEGFDVDQAKAEAARCMVCECLECVKKCAFMQHYQRYPRKYVREVYNNLSIAMGQHHANDMINTCALCGQCEAICPNGLDMREVFRAAREQMVDNKKMPPSAHEFALLDMDYSLSAASYLIAHEPGHTESAFLFFPGCQLPASEPELVKHLYDRLRLDHTGGVGLWLGCCGIMAQWGGERELFAKTAQRLRQDWEAMGGPQILSACPTCTATFEDQLQLPVTSIFELLADSPRTLAQPLDQDFILHHACGARHRPELKEDVRQVANASGIRLLADPVWDTEHPCCGYGGLLSYNDRALADEMTQEAARQLENTDHQPILTYCVNCRDRFLANGQEASLLLELLDPRSDQLSHRPPTFSERQENRSALKRALLEELWKITMEKEPELTLYLDEALEQKLEARHILKREIKQAIAQAELHQLKLLNPTNGHLTTSYRPGNVTFWVEYLPESDGFRLINAYTHRMQAVVSDHISEGRSQHE